MKRYREVIRKALGLALALVLLAAMGLAALGTLPAMAAAQINITLTPSATTANVNDTFTVTVDVQCEDAQQVRGIATYIHFDHAVLEVVDADPAKPGVQIQGTATPFELRIDNIADNTAGTIDYSAGTFVTPPSTDFRLATITFKAKAATVGTNITFDMNPPRKTDATVGGTSVLGTLTGVTGFVIQSPRVNITLIPSATNATMGTTFTVDIVVQPQSGQQVSRVDVFINFVPAVLEVVDADPAKPGVQIQGTGTPFDQQLLNIADNTAGTIDYSAGTFGTPPSTDFRLATITFRAKAATVGTNITFNTTFPRITNAALNGISVVGTLTGISGLAILPFVTPVTFPDPNLEAAIRQAINKPEGPIYPADLQQLTRLDPYGRGIADLRGLEHCTKLTELTLWQNQISNLSPLANLTELTGLYAGENQIADLSPLASLTKLTELTLWKNQISDLSALANLTSLTKLYLQINQISDISPLVNNGLSSGMDVHLWRNPLSATSRNVSIPQLEARGANVYWTLPGDLNQDGKVSILDLTLVAGAFGSTLGAPGWNASADWNNDGKVDLFDLVAVGVNLGRVW